MENNPDNSLDEKIKESLSKYLASKEASDWARMETMLDAAPKASAFRWSSILNVVIGLAVVGGGYLLYNNIHTSKTEEKTELAAPGLTSPVSSSSVVSVPPAATIQSNTNTLKPNEESIAKKENTTSVINETKSTINMEVAKTSTSSNEKTSTVKVKKPQQIFVMGNQPVFGDMLDSSKGIIGETKEKEATQKAAIIHSDKPIGWNKIINEDSLKKLNEEKLINPPKDRGPK